MKKFLSITLCLLTLCLLFCGCGGKKTKGGKVYYLNFKPEQDKAWQQLAEEYQKETGVEVKVVTAAEGKYEETLTAEIDKSSAPTLFQISGQIALDSWRDYCLDLRDTDVYRELTSDDFAIKDGDSVYGIAYVYEGYGLITNKKLLEKAGYKIEDITSFDKLREVAESITARKAELGFSAFTSAGLASSSSWRFSGHLANMPLFYEFEADGIKTQPATIKGTYLDKYKALWDLYINNSTIDPATLTSEQNDAAVEFKNGKAVFYQNGTWEYSNIASIGDENIGYLPIYTGIRDEKQGLCCGTENYWAVNKTASEADRKATLDFLKWVVTSEKGTNALAKDMGFVSPFKSAKDVDNVLCNIMNEYVEEGRYNVSWAFNHTPNVETWRSGVTSALAAYSAGKGNWDSVVRAFVDGWAEQYKLSKQ